MSWPSYQGAGKLEQYDTEQFKINFMAKNSKKNRLPFEPSSNKKKPAKGNSNKSR